MVTLDNLVVTTALPVIRHDLHANLQQLEWTINAYTLTFAVLLLTGAALGDRFGRRRIFSIGLALFTLGSAASALAGSPTMLIVARAHPGRRRGDGDTIDTNHPERGGPGEPSRRRARRLGRHRRPRGRGRADRRWRHRPGHLVALDLLGQRADRPVARSARAHPSRPRRAAPTTTSTWAASSSPAPVSSRSSGASCAPINRAGRAPRFSEHSPSAWRLWWCSSSTSSAPAAPMLPIRLLPQPDLQRRERGFAVHVLRDVRQRLPARAVLPDGAGAFATRRGSSDPSMDRDADSRRAHSRGSRTASTAAP